MHFTIAYKSELHTYIDEPKTQKCLFNDIRMCMSAWLSLCIIYTIKQDPGCPFKHCFTFNWRLY